VLSEGKGVPVAVLISAAKRSARKKVAALRAAVVSARPTPQAQRAQQGEEHWCRDRGYDYDSCRAQATARGSLVPSPPTASAAQPWPAPGAAERHPPRRGGVEVSHAWLHRCRRLLIRWHKQAANYLGFVPLAICLLIYRKLRHARSLSG
jgi:hypothetical protein